MSKFIEEHAESILLKSMKNAFIGKEEVVEEAEPTLKEEIAKAIANDREAKERLKEELEKELAEKALYKSKKATTSDEKEEEITEKNVKNTITINPDLKETIVGKIYAMYNNKYLDEKQYTLTNADKKGNTPAWQNRDKKNVKTGEPLYKKADHMKKEGYQRDPDRQEKDRKTSKQTDPSKDNFTGIGDSIADIMKQNAAMKKAAAKKTKKEEVEAVGEAKVDQGKTAEKKSSDRNKRNTPPGADSKFDTKVFITRKDGESLDSARTRKRREAHADKRGVKEEKKTLTIEENDKLYLMKANGDVAYEVTDLLLPDPITELNRYSKETGKSLKTGRSVKKGGSDDKALNFVRSKIRKETGKPEGQRKKVKGAKSNEKNTSLERKIDKLKSKRAYADRAKKAGFKSTQDYTNTVARYGGEDNYKKGRGLGT